MDTRTTTPPTETDGRRYLVTGAAGFIGSHLVEALLERGHRVVGIDGFVDSYEREVKVQNLLGALGDRHFEFVELDLRTDDVRPWVEDVDVVVNEAAFAGLPRSWTDVESYVGCNLLAVQRLVVAALDAGVSRFVQASTSSVYGLNAVGDERMATEPISPYGISKLAAEQLIQAHVVAHGLPATILRYFSIYGPRQRPDMAYHIFIERLRRGLPVTVFGDGRQSRSNTFVADCVAGTLAAVDRGEVGTVYNIGGGAEIELLDAIEIIADELGVHPRIEHRPPRPGDQRRTCADTSRARETFDYRPTVDPEDGLRAQVRWHLEQLPSGSDGSTPPLLVHG